MMDSNKELPEHFDEYSNIQKVKHDIVRNYLKGWFPKMTLGVHGQKKLMYVDTHAGRGRFRDGQIGSPLVAVDTLLKHQRVSQILSNTEIRFYLMELDCRNFRSLQHEIAELPKRPNLIVQAFETDSFQAIADELRRLNNEQMRLCPGFFFVDPFGIKVPFSVFEEIMRYPKTEVFVNVMWRELDMAIRHANGIRRSPTPRSDPKRQTTLFLEPDADSDQQEEEFEAYQDRMLATATESKKESWIRTVKMIFGNDLWREIDAETPDERADQCAEKLRQVVNAKWGTHFRMIKAGRVRYFLLHFTNHDDGRELMKDVMWKSSPVGGFSASNLHQPQQRILIVPEPDLRPLQAWIVDQLQKSPRRWEELLKLNLRELWLSKHVNEVIKQLARLGRIKSSSGKFTKQSNPLLSLV